jgi:hypothetical protein
VTLVPDAGTLRRPPLVVAAALIFVVVALELGAGAFLKGAGDAAEAIGTVQNSAQLQRLTPSQQTQTLNSVGTAAEQEEPPGLGIPYLALLDGLFAYALVWMLLSFVVSERVLGKVQGIVSLIVSILLILGTIILILLALAKLLLMIALFFAPPFGTIAYLAVWGSFPKGTAAVILSLIMALKLAACVCLLLAQQRFAQNKGLLILVILSLVATIVVSFLHALVPLPLVSITDALAAIVVGIIAVIWALVLLVGSVISVVMAITTT